MAGIVLATLLSVGLTACSGSSEKGGDDTKASGSGSSAPPAPPGKYQTLPEPCSAVGVGTLKDLLPGAGSDKDGQDPSPSASPYKGHATVTYDTDRRVGCRWKSSTSLGSRHLAVDLERVVSYDPSVSDDKQAELLYDERAGQADIPTDGPGSSDSASPSPDGKSSASDKDSQEGKNGKGGDGGSGSEKSDSGSPSPDASGSGASPSGEGNLSPRTLQGIADDAYIDDQLNTADSGVHRDITLVFRNANVIATVKYDQWLTDKHRIPDSAELQQKARSVAQELAAGFDDN